MKRNKILSIFNMFFLIGIFATGCSTTQAVKIVDIDQSSFNIQNDLNYPISNIHVEKNNGELFIKGSVSHRYGRSSLLTGHVDISFLNSDGSVKKKECVGFENHFSKRSCERQANFELPVTEDLLSSSSIKISYIPKK